MLRTGQSPAPSQGRSSSASTPGSHPTPGVLLPGTLASPRTGLTPAGCRELVARLRRGALLSVLLGARAAGRTFLRNQPCVGRSRRTVSGEAKGGACHAAGTQPNPATIPSSPTVQRPTRTTVAAGCAKPGQQPRAHLGPGGRRQLRGPILGGRRFEQLHRSFLPGVGAGCSGRSEPSNVLASIKRKCGAREPGCPGRSAPDLNLNA